MNHTRFWAWSLMVWFLSRCLYLCVCSSTAPATVHYNNLIANWRKLIIIWFQAHTDQSQGKYKYIHCVVVNPSSTPHLILLLVDGGVSLFFVTLHNIYISIAHCVSILSLSSFMVVVVVPNTIICPDMFLVVLLATLFIYLTPKMCHLEAHTYIHL